MKITFTGPVLLLCAAVVLLGACNPQPARSKEAYAAEMDKWVGRPMDEVKRAWGPPVSETRLSTNNNLVRFKRMLPMGIANGRCFTTFEVDSGFTIVSHSSEGPACKLRPKMKGR